MSDMLRHGAESLDHSGQTYNGLGSMQPLYTLQVLVQQVERDLLQHGLPNLIHDPTTCDKGSTLNDKSVSGRYFGVTKDAQHPYNLQQDNHVSHLFLCRFIACTKVVQHLQHLHL